MKKTIISLLSKIEIVSESCYAANVILMFNIFHTLSYKGKSTVHSYSNFNAKENSSKEIGEIE